jgi:hypothetical protein
MSSSSAKQVQGKKLNFIEGITPDYFRRLSKDEVALTCAAGSNIGVWTLHVPAGCPYLSSWASQFRQHYRLDAELDALISGTGKTKAQYLKEHVFHGGAEPPGPSIRSGDFAELLIADYMQVVHKAWVPRQKYSQKVNPNESIKGTDVIGFHILDSSLKSKDDELFIYEVKAQLTDRNYSNQLQSAVTDSAKDFLRSATTLAALKLRLRREFKFGDADKVERFQNPSDNPFTFRSGAAAVLSGKSYNATEIGKTDISRHNNRENLELVVVRGNELMTLVHELYRRAADEA